MHTIESLERENARLRNTIGDYQTLMETAAETIMGLRKELDDASLPQETPGRDYSYAG